MKDNTLIFQCNGFSFDGLVIPQFNVYENEIICLHFPFGRPVDNRLGLTQTMIDNIDNKAINTSGTIQFVDSYTLDERRFIFFRKKLVREKIYDKLGCMDDECISFLHDYNIDANIPYRLYGGTERLLIALFIALRFSDLVLFPFSGLDPTGVNKVFDFITRTLKGKGAIILSFPHIRGTNESDFCYICEDIHKRNDNRIRSIELN